jgi:hypothetical protein
MVHAFDEAIKDISEPWIVKTDIAGFYDNIPREKAIALCEQIGMQKEVLELLQKWSNTLKIRTGHLSFSDFKPDTKGLPQGLSISSSLAELYAKEIDKHYLNNKRYFRYVDDVVMICSSYEEAKDTLNEFKKIVQAYGLETASKKTTIINFEKGFEWLGMQHEPNRKKIANEKFEQWIKPFTSIKRECVAQLANCRSVDEKNAAIHTLLKNIKKHIQGKYGNRIRWYSLCEDKGQWKKMDQYIHGIIRSCIRKAKINEVESFTFPSIHAKIHSIKKLRSHNTADKG